MGIEHAEFGGPCVGVDGSEGGGETKPWPDFCGKEKMQGGEESGDATVAKDLTCVTLVAFGKFFVEALFAFFEGAA
jgi:hypothetical protein